MVLLLMVFVIGNDLLKTLGRQSEPGETTGCLPRRAAQSNAMRKSRPVQVKHVQIGGGAPVSIQSMTKTDTADVGATVAQIEEMVRAGCEIVRLAVPDNDAAWR